MSQAQQKEIKSKRVVTGTVKSDKMDKTIVVQIEKRLRHPLYGKIISRYSKYKAHDEKNEAKTGDRVSIRESRPLSKDKRWVLIKIHDSASAEGASS